MDDLRQRLARFDRPAAPKAGAARPEHDPLRRLLDAGADAKGVIDAVELAVEADPYAVARFEPEADVGSLLAAEQPPAGVGDVVDAAADALTGAAYGSAGER